MKNKLPNVFETTMHGSKSWVCDGRFHGLKREYFPTRAQAQGRAETVFRQVFGFNTNPIIDLPQHVILDASRANQILGPLSGNLLDAAKFYAEHLRQKMAGSILLNEAATKWLTLKKNQGVRRATLVNLETRIASLVSACGDNQIHAVKSKMIHEWIHGLDLALTSKLDYKKTAQELFAWFIFQEWIQENPCAAIKLKNPEEVEVSIFTVDQARDLFAAAKASDIDLLRYVILCMFAGLRPSEAAKANSTDIINNGAEIRVHAGKTGRFRYVKLEKGVKKHLQKWEGPLLDGNFNNRWNALRASLGYRVWTAKKKMVNGKQVFYSDTMGEDRPQWPHDVMRHTYCSYHLAAFQNEALTAHQAGHDVKVLRKHYRRPIPKTEGEKFWSIIQ